MRVYWRYGVLHQIIVFIDSDNLDDIHVLMLDESALKQLLTIIWQLFQEVKVNSKMKLKCLYFHLFEWNLFKHARKTLRMDDLIDIKRGLSSKNSNILC